MWPPPGTESLHGLLGRVRSRSAAASIFLALPTLFMALDPGMLLPDGHARWVLALAGVAIAAGVAVWIGAALAVMTVVDGVRRAARLGYPRGLLLEVAADTAHDGGMLATGTGSFRGVAPETRSSLGRLRVWRAWLAALGAALPGPCAVAGLLLAFRGDLGRAGMVLLVLGPGVTLILVAAVMTGWEKAAAALDRGAAAWDPDPSTPRDRAEAWLGTAAARGAARDSAGLRWLLAGAAVTAVGALVVALLVAVSMAATAAVSIGALAAIEPMRGESGLAARAGVLEALLADAPADSSLTPGAAGAVLHGLLAAYAGEEWRDGTREGLLRPPPEPASAVAAGPTGILRLLARRSGSVERAFRGQLTPEELDALTERPAPPPLDLLRTVSSAPDVDVLGARLALPLPARTEPGDVSRAVAPSLTAIFDAGTLQAMVDVREGRVAAAEAMLRALVLFGARVALTTPLIWEADASGRAALNTVDRLASVLALSGRDAEAARLHGRVLAAEEVLRVVWGRPPPVGEMALIIHRAVAADARHSPAERWAALEAYLLVRGCGSVSRVLFAPPPRADDRISAVLVDLGARPADNALLATVLDPPPFRYYTRGPVGFVGRLLGERTAAGRCGRTLRLSPDWL
ncbi:MAG: hypothetical protein WEB88_04035 [Gemmatimonadota bacterium]